jgi:hypothetical protein
VELIGGAVVGAKNEALFPGREKDEAASVCVRTNCKMSPVGTAELSPGRSPG